MSATSVYQLTIDLNTKLVTCLGTVAVRESVGVSLAGAQDSDASGLILRILDANQVEVAACSAWVAAGVLFAGTLALSGTLLAAAFSGEPADKVKRFTLQLVNVAAGNESLLINDFLPIMNNQFTSAMEAAL